MKSIDLHPKEKNIEANDPEIPIIQFDQSRMREYSEVQNIATEVIPNRSTMVQSSVVPKPPKNNNWLRKYLVISICAAVLLIIAFVGIKFTTFVNAVSVTHFSAYKNLKDDIGASLGGTIPQLGALDQTIVGEAVRGNKEVNILLLGYGGDGHSGAYLTDSMVVLNLNFATDKAAFISIPRDTWVKIPTDGNNGQDWKINAAYEIGMDSKQFPNKLPEFTGPAGGGALAMYMVSQVTGLQIDHYVAIDFQGFQKIVDTLGGVYVNVDNAFTDYSYPNGDENVDGPGCAATATESNSTCRYEVVHFTTGLQYMNGARALEYVRSRHAAGVEGSDFARSKRQQKLMAAIEQKALALNVLPKIFNLMDDIDGHFTTDLSVAEIKDIADEVPKFDFDSATHASIVDNGLLVSTTSSDGQYILIPKSGTFTDIQSYVAGLISQNNE